MKPGTLVMTKMAGPLARTYGLYIGAIGEVIAEPSGNIEEPIMAKFPCVPAFTFTFKAEWLVPLSDPDAELDTKHDLSLSVSDFNYSLMPV